MLGAASLFYACSISTQQEIHVCRLVLLVAHQGNTPPGSSATWGLRAVQHPHDGEIEDCCADLEMHK